MVGYAMKDLVFVFVHLDLVAQIVKWVSRICDVAVRKRNKRQDEILILFYAHFTGISKVVFLSTTYAFLNKHFTIYAWYIVKCAYL